MPPRNALAGPPAPTKGPRLIAGTALVGAVMALTAALAVGTAPLAVALSAWSAPTEVSGAAGGGAFYGVSCTAAGDCTAVGADGRDQPIYATEAAGTWGKATAVNTPVAGGEFRAVSCTAPGDCTAVGYDSRNEPIYATEAGAPGGAPPRSTSPAAVVSKASAAPGPVTAPPSDGPAARQAPCTPPTLPAPGARPARLHGTAPELLYSVSCAGAGDCTAVGSAGGFTSFAATEAGGVWGDPTRPTPAPPGSR